MFFFNRTNHVIYWPSTEPSIKRCTCVNKRKNGGSRLTSNKNITRTQTAWVSWSWIQLETRLRTESQRQTEGFEPSVTHGLATPAKMRKKCYYGQKNFGSICSSLSPSPTHLLHTTNINPFENKKCERYHFIKNCVRSFIEVRHYVWLCSAYICIYIWLSKNPTKRRFFSSILYFASALWIYSSWCLW